MGLPARADPCLFPCPRPGSWRLQVDTSILISHVPPLEDEGSGWAPRGFEAVSKAMFPNEFPRTPWSVGTVDLCTANCKSVTTSPSDSSKRAAPLREAM